MVYRATVERGRRRGRRNWAPFNWEGFKPCVVCEPPVSLPFVCISGLVVTRILRGAELINQDYGALSIWKAGIRPRWHPLARSLPRALLLSLGRSSRARRKLEFIEMHQPNPICVGVGGGGVGGEGFRLFYEAKHSPAKWQFAGCTHCLFHFIFYFRFDVFLRRDFVFFSGFCYPPVLPRERFAASLFV